MVGFEFAAYSASKLCLEGWMESLPAEVDPFGIHTTIVDPGFFRTELLTDESTTEFAEPFIDDYAERSSQQMQYWKGYNGRQSGDPAKFTNALITITGEETPPLRFRCGCGGDASTIA